MPKEFFSSNNSCLYFSGVCAHAAVSAKIQTATTEPAQICMTIGTSILPGLWRKILVEDIYPFAIAVNIFNGEKRVPVTYKHLFF